MVVSRRRLDRPAGVAIRGRRFQIESLERRDLLAASVIISEFMADNENTLADQDGEFSDWIELYNAGDAAENLDGWFLSDNAQELDKWRLPNVTLAPGEHRLVFTSGKDRRDPAAELHTNFRLEQNGEYLALVQPDGTTPASQFAPFFAPQRSDVSYGPSFSVNSADLVAADATATITIPTTSNGGAALETSWTGLSANEPFDDTGWIHGAFPVGYGSGGSTVVATESQSFLSAFAAATAGWTGYRHSDATLRTNFGFAPSANSGGTAGEAGGAVPGRTAEIAYYADTSLGGALSQQRPLLATGRLTVESISALDGGFEIGWFDPSITQGVTSVLGIRVVDGTATSVRWGPHRDVGGVAENILPGDQLIVGQDYRFTIQYDPGAGGAGVLSAEFRRANDNVSLGARTLSVPSGGPPVSLTAFGIKTLDFNANIGGSAGVFLDDLVYTTLATVMPGTNIESDMKDINSVAFMRTSFNLVDADSLNRLELQVRYNDGFIAYLNGSEIARRNALDPVAWDSTATVKRTPPDAAAIETIDLTAHLGALRAGTNILALHGLNFSASDNDFLIEPRLTVQLVAIGDPRFHLTPTPLAANGEGVVGFVADTQFSVDRGFYTDPITVVVTSPTPGATIAYTLDGSAPTPTHGIQVPAADALTPPSASLAIAGTTTLRALAYKDQHQPTNVDTQTYLFASDIARQSNALALARGFPSVWQPGVAADYAMDPTIVDDPRFSSLIDDSLRAIPSLSIVSDLDSLFGPANGIYNHSENRDDAWERPASIEWIDRTGADEDGADFQLNAGVRIHGGSSRSPASTIKHSLRLSFDPQYGPANLEFPLFAGTAVDQFDKLVLRGPYTDSWTPRTIDPEYHPANAQYFRDQWMRDAQREMGHLSAHGRYAHVYLNGLYWGLYNVTERTDSQFAAEHLGGPDEEYDAIKDSEALDGNRQAWDAMMAIANSPTGLAGMAEYQAIQQYLDPANLADYMLLHVFSGGLDWPDHNWAAVRRRATGEKFHFLVWDQDIGLDDPSALTNHALVDAADSPARLYNRLLANAEFRRLLADRVQEHFFGDGALTIAAAQQRWLGLAAPLETAIIAESARWGDVRESQTNTTYTRDDWLAQRDYVVGTLIPQRHSLALSQLRAAGLFPSVIAPTFSPHGGTITAGATVNVDAPDGTIYYTVDGSDPQLADGSLNPAALAVGIRTTPLVAPGAATRVLVPTVENGGNLLGTSWTGALAGEPFNDASWLAANTAVGFPALAGTETMSFATQSVAAAAGWTEHRTHDAALQTDYGFRDTSTAGGGAGEAGGKIPSRTASISYYADTSIGVFSQQEPLSATGKLTVSSVDAGYDGGFHVGFFDASLTEGSPNVIGYRILEESATTLRWQARAVIHGQIFEAAPLANLTIGADYTFTISYTPSAGAGHLSVQLARQSDGVPIGTSTLNIPTGGTSVSLDAFGLMSLDLGVNAPQSVNTFVDDLTYSSGPEFPVTTDVEQAMRHVNASAFLRASFTIDDFANWDSLTLRMKYDDAFVAYLNGVEVARSANAPGLVAWDSVALSSRPDSSVLSFEEFDLTPRLSLLHAGVNVLAVQGLNVSAADADFLLLPELVAVENLESGVTLNRTSTIRARTLAGGDWSALTESRFTVETPIRVTEINYHPGGRSAAEIAAGFINDDDFEFIEVTNVHPTDAVDLAGVRFIGGIQFTFGALTLPPGQSAVLVRDPAAFALRYGPAVMVGGTYGGTPDDVRLSNSGEIVTLVDAGGGLIQSFRYDDDWHAATDGDGATLVSIDSGGPTTDWSSASGWRESFESGGSPGQMDRMPGDSNDDLRVGSADLAALQAHFQFTTGAAMADGDFNGDGVVNRADVVILARNFGRRFPASPSPPSTAASQATVAQATVGSNRSSRPRQATSVSRGSAVDRVLVDTADSWFKRPLLRATRTTRQR